MILLSYVYIILLYCYIIFAAVILQRFAFKYKPQTFSRVCMFRFETVRLLLET